MLDVVHWILFISVRSIIPRNHALTLQRPSIVHSYPLRIGSVPLPSRRYSLSPGRPHQLAHRPLLVSLHNNSRPESFSDSILFSRPLLHQHVVFLVLVMECGSIFLRHLVFLILSSKRIMVVTGTKRHHRTELCSASLTRSTLPTQIFKPDGSCTLHLAALATLERVISGVPLLLRATTSTQTGRKHGSAP